MVPGISGIFYVKTTGNFGCFQYLNSETNFLKNENLFFKKLENSCEVENTIESITYPYKTTLSEANVKTSRMGSTNGPITKNAALPVSIFWIFFFSIRTSYKELIWSTNYPNVHIHTFRKCWSFIWGCFFPMSILKTYSAAMISIWMCYVLWEQFCCSCM